MGRGIAVRVTTTLECVGKNFQEFVDFFNKQWKQLSGDSNQDLPPDSEIIVEKSEKDNQYIAKCVVRTKLS